MLAPTHAIFGLFLSLILLAVFGIQESLHWSILLFAVIGSLGPDIDHPTSLIGRLFFFISKPLDKKFGHRTATHSLIGWSIATALCAIFVGVFWVVWQVKGRHGGLPLQFMPFQEIWYRTIDAALMKRWVAAFSIGYFSHILLDMFNPRGAQLLWPNLNRDVIFNAKFRPESGSKTEIVIFILLSVLLVFALPLSKFGMATSLRWFLATPEAAIEEVKAMKTKSFVAFEGTFNSTHEGVKGKAEILDVKNKKLIVFYEGKVYTLSDELASDIIAKHVRVEKTDQPITTEQKVFENKNREYLLGKLPPDALVSGKIHLPKDLKLSVPHKSIEQVGDELRLTFATKKQLQALSWDESFDLMRKQDQARLLKLNRDETRLKNELKHVNDMKGLTELGAKMLMTAEERDAKTQKRESLQSQLEELQIARDELAFKMKQHEFLFSGDVTIRL